MLSAPGGSAQVLKGSNQLDIGYGWPNYPKELLSPGILFGGSDRSGIGPFTLTYHYAVSRRLTIGLQGGYTYAQSSWQVTLYDPSGNGVSKGAFARLAIIDGGLKADYHFLESERYDFYAGMMAGAAFMTGKANEDIGLGIGTYNLSANAFEYKVNTGLRVRLTSVTGLFAEGIFQQIILDGIFVEGVTINGGMSFRLREGKETHQKHK